MVTSCQWRQMKVITPNGEDSKVIYVFSQVGKQQLELTGSSMVTTLSTNASRLEFITIQELLEAQCSEQMDEGIQAQWLRCEQEVLASIDQLPEPFQGNVSRKLAIATPFAVYYFANWNFADGPIVTIPISLFSGDIAPALLGLMRQFPLTVEALPLGMEANVSLSAAFAVAAKFLEGYFANPETGRTGLIWCDSASQEERHRRYLTKSQPEFSWDHLQLEEGESQLIGLHPLEYINLAVVMVPFALLAFEHPVQGCGYGIVDPVLSNLYLTDKQLEI